jgi:ribosome-associated protein
MADIRINDRITIPGRELSVAFARSGGPGGQNVNKVESKVELRWQPSASGAFTSDDRSWLLTRLAPRLTTGGELIVTSTVTRDQVRNRADAEAKLGAIVRAALFRPKKRRPTKPSRGATERRIQSKKRRATVKQGRRGSGDD